MKTTCQRLKRGFGAAHRGADEEVVIEHHFEDWIAIIIFWAWASRFVQFLTRYVLTIPALTRRSRAIC